eukprot:634615-Hanusia_phi.AAC.4
MEAERANRNKLTYSRSFTCGYRHCSETGKQRGDCRGGIGGIEDGREATRACEGRDRGEDERGGGRKIMRLGEGEDERNIEAAQGALGADEGRKYRYRHIYPGPGGVGGNAGTGSGMPSTTRGPGGMHGWFACMGS